MFCRRGGDKKTKVNCPICNKDNLELSFRCYAIGGYFSNKYLINYPNEITAYRCDHCNSAFTENLHIIRYRDYIMVPVVDAEMVE